MKKYTVLLLLIFASAFCFAYSKPKKAASVQVSKTGAVRVYGNEPFTYYGFTCDSGEVYTIVASDELMTELKQNQGKHIEIKGYLDNSNEPDKQMNKLKDGYLVVEKWKKVD